MIEITILKTLSPGALIGDNNGNYTVWQPMDLARAEQTRQYKFISALPLPFTEDVTTVTFSHIAETPDGPKRSTWKAEVHHLVDVGCAVAFDRLHREWRVNDNMTYSQDIIERTRKEQKRRLKENIRKTNKGDYK